MLCFLLPEIGYREPVAQAQYVVSNTRCPALYISDCRSTISRAAACRTQGAQLSLWGRDFSIEAEIWA